MDWAQNIPFSHNRQGIDHQVIMNRVQDIPLGSNSKEKASSYQLTR